MSRISLTPQAIKLIHDAIDRLFAKAKSRFLTPEFIQEKKITFSFRPNLSLPGLFNAASIEERNKPDEHVLNSLVRIADGYIEATRHTTKSQVVKAIDSFLKDTQAKKIKTDVETVLGGQLADVWRKTTQAMTRIVDTESTTARNTGSLDGIVKINLASGIEDPVVYFVVVRDNHLCDECKRLHLMPDGVTPRLWYLSEVKNSYHKKGEEYPSLNGLHPSCRCSCCSCMPGYGFNKSGMITYIGSNHNEIERQRG